MGIFTFHSTTESRTSVSKAGTKANEYDFIFFKPASFQGAKVKSFVRNKDISSSLTGKPEPKKNVR
jgi:hypothetical protein